MSRVARIGTGAATPASPGAASPPADADVGENLSVAGEEDPGAALDLVSRTADEPGAASRCGIGRERSSMRVPDAGVVDHAAAGEHAIADRARASGPEVPTAAAKVA